MLAERLSGDGQAFAEAWNFGPKDEDIVSVRQLAEKIVRHWGRGEFSNAQPAESLHEAHYLKLDCSKAHVRLGWWPVLGLDEAVQMTVAWYQGCMADSQSASRMTVSQIEGYAERGVS